MAEDRFDEVWEGVHHRVPPPSFEHQQRAGRLYRRLAELLEGTDLGVAFETGLFDPARTDTNYRVPDLVVFRPEHTFDKGVHGAVVVVEIRSEDDASWDKLPFYAERGVDEVWILDPAADRFDLMLLRGGRYVAASETSPRSAVLGVSLVWSENVLSLR